ncbi:hypothetical protein Tco_0455764 [Tanacetum coccineum]
MYWLFNSFSSKIVTGWTIQTFLWNNTSGSRKKKLENTGKCLTGKLLSMVKSGMMKTFTTSDPLKTFTTFNDGVSSKTLSCEPTVSSLNDKIDFRISFDDSDDEDYTVFFEENSFFYKIISTNDLKMDLENDNEKVNLPSLPPSEPAINYALWEVIVNEDSPLPKRTVNGVEQTYPPTTAEEKLVRKIVPNTPLYF